MKKFTAQAGYTLLETAIVLGVVGIVILSTASAYSLYLKNKAISDTVSNVNLSMNAISNYFIQNGKYPCPARLDAKRTDADYGMPVPNCASIATAPGTCAGGLCVEQRDATIPTLVPPKPLVIRGAVPFRILNKPEPVSFDGYHSRLEYAVTGILTDVTTYNKDHGAISVVDAQMPPRSVVKDPDTIHFIVLSHGPDRNGAWSVGGAPVFPCGTDEDAENCNTSPPDKSAIYRMAPLNSANGSDHFDDLVKFFSTIETPLWVVADAAGTNIRDAGLAKQVTVAQSTTSFAPTDPISIDVPTNVRATTDLRVGQLCNPTGGDCFPSLLVAGNDPDMDCATSPLSTGPYATGISGGKIVCGPKVDITCPTGQVMRGITGAGSLICTAPPASCAATNVTVCALNDDSLPASPSGAPPIWTSIHGDSRRLQFTCTAAGTWVQTNASGYCTCPGTPGTTVTTPTCQGNFGPAGSCWTGNIIRSQTVTCSPYTVTTVDNTSACQCSGCAVPTTTSCSAALPSPLTNPTAPGLDTPPLPTPSGWLGNAKYNKNWVCSSTTTGSFANWTYLSQSPVCACNLTITPLNDTVVCSAIGATACDSTGGNPSLAGQYPCTPGFTGNVTRHKNYNCATGAYDATWTNDTNTCSCSAVLDHQNIACPTGYSGTIAQTRTFNCATNAWGTWSNDLPGSPPSSCIPIQWVPQGSISGSGSSPIGQEVYTPCSPVNSTSACWAPSGSGDPYNYYTLCKCQ